MAGNPANLRPPWPKGVSGNPSGLPKKKPVTDRYDAILALPLPDDVRRVLKLEKGATYGDALAFRVIMNAIKKGDVASAREVREAIEGKARQRVEITGAEGKPIQTRSTGPRPMQRWSPEQLDAIRKIADKVAERPEAGAGDPPPA